MDEKVNDNNKSNTLVKNEIGDCPTEVLLFNVKTEKVEIDEKPLVPHEDDLQDIIHKHNTDSTNKQEFEELCIKHEIHSECDLPDFKIEVDDLQLNENTKQDCEENKNQCPYCKRSFETKRQQSNHRCDKSLETCCYCGQLFSQKLQFLNDSNPIQCENCSLKDPIETRHSRTPKKRKIFSCKICSKLFSNQSNLHRHLKMHDLDTGFQCDVCKKKFTRKDNLNTHVRIHTKETPFKWHMVTHTTETPITCKLCSKTFTLITSLNRHMQKHIGRKA